MHKTWSCKRTRFQIWTAAVWVVSSRPRGGRQVGFERCRRNATRQGTAGHVAWLPTWSREARAGRLDWDPLDQHVRAGRARGPRPLSGGGVTGPCCAGGGAALLAACFQLPILFVTSQVAFSSTVRTPVFRTPVKTQHNVRCMPGCDEYCIS